MAICYSAAGRSHSQLVSKTDKYLSVGCTMLRQKYEYQTEHMIVKSGNQSVFQYTFSLQS